MIPLAVPNLTGNERKYLNECIDTTFVSSVGEFVNRLEGGAAEATGAVAAVATSAGTTALHASLVVLGVRPGDLVIVPSFTFIASANSIRHAGADPWFMDVDLASWCIDVNQIEAELREHAVLRNGCAYHKETGRRISAVMPVYTLGNTPDMGALALLAEEWNLPIIADAACAIGVTYQGRPLADLADLSAISLNGNKTITAGGGGLIVGKDPALLDEVKHLTTTARVWPAYDFDRVGYNYRLTNLQAAVAVAQLERLEEFLTVKKAVHERYQEAFSGLGSVSLFPMPDWCDATCWFSGIVIDDSARTSEIVSRLNEQGVGAGSFWKPAHLQEPYKASLSAPLPVTEGLWNRVITLPCSTGITEKEIETVIEAVRSAIGEG